MMAWAGEVFDIKNRIKNSQKLTCILIFEGSAWMCGLNLTWVLIFNAFLNVKQAASPIKNCGDRYQKNQCREAPKPGLRCWCLTTRTHKPSSATRYTTEYGNIRNGKTRRPWVVGVPRPGLTASKPATRSNSFRNRWATPLPAWLSVKIQSVGQILFRAWVKGIGHREIRA